jgi:ribonuclease D
MPHFQYVDHPDALADTLQNQGRVGVDTEFMRESTYYSQLCLVQISTRDAIYCVDPLTNQGQAAFWESLFEHEWVVHSARQDIEVVYQTAGAMPSSIFDTQVAAALLGHPPQVGYAALVKTLFDVDMDKSHTRADWSKRPLRDAYLEYAAEDVEHLLPAADRLGEELDRLGRLAWAQEDSAAMLDPALYVTEDVQAVDRLKGARNLRGRKRAIAARLAAWREAEAIARNRPRQWILRDSVLMEIVFKMPAASSQLEAIEGMPPKVAARSGKALLEAVAGASADDHDYTPPGPPDEGQKALLKEMQARVAACAMDLGIAAETVASKRELSAVIISGSRDSRVFRGWRGQLIGGELLQLL